MILKYANYTDEMLVKLVNKGNNDAQLELIDRYKRNANTLGRQIYYKFKNTINCDAEDLINCGLVAVIIASKSYDGSKKFFSYWQVVATNEIMDLVKECSDKYNCNNNFEFINFADNEEDIACFAENDIYEGTLYQDLVLLIESPKIKLKPLTKNIFKMYIAGYSHVEIAKKFNIKVHIVRYHINLAKEKLTKILLHS